MKQQRRELPFVQDHFLRSVQRGDPKFHYLPRHVLEVQRWARKLLRLHRGANRKVVLLAVWLHDIGLTIGNQHVDHAIKSEREVRRLLKSIKVKPALINGVAHCVRAHRCRDIQPNTIEAQILAAADSASHMTDTVYLELLPKGLNQYVRDKVEKDFRDIGLFPALQKELQPLYRAWKKLVRVYPV